MRRSSIGTLLGILTGTLVILAVLIAVVNGIMAFRLVDQRAEDTTRQLARTATLVVDGFIDDAGDALTGLATEDLLPGAPAEACADHVRQNALLMTQFSALLALDDEGEMRCASAGFDQGLDSFRETVQRLRELGGGESLVVGSIHRLEGRRGWVVPVGHALRDDDGAFRGAVVGLVDVERIHRLLDQIPLPPDGIITIVDIPTQRIVARSSEPEAWLGRRLEADVTASQARQGYAVRLESVDGVERMWGIEPMTRVDWTVSAGFPTAWIRGPVWDTVGTSALLALSLVVLAIILAHRVRRWIVGPIRTLVDQSRSAAQGHTQSIDIQGPEELRELARTFNRTLEDRETLNEYLRRAERMEAVSRFTGGVAHEFRNLLTEVTGEVSLARAETDDPELTESLDRIESAAARASDLTTKLLAASEQDPGSIDVIDLSETVAREARLLTLGLDAKHRLKPRLADDLPPVRCGRRRAKTILQELVSNALDAMPEGGVVRVRTFEPEDVEPLAGDGPETAGSETGPEDASRYAAVLEVEDEGEGMDPQVRRRIFEPFFTTRSRAERTGLGLSTIRGLVRQAEGRVEVRSEPGEGTRVRVFLVGGE